MTRAILLLALPVFLAAASSMLATDLYLPAIPILPEVLNGDAVGAQYTLAVFFATFAIGQLVFGALADLYDRGLILTWSLAAFAVASAACAMAETMDTLILLRAIQGFAASAGTALAPALLREAGDDSVVVRLTSIVSSMESVLPAMAPILGAWLISLFGWPSTFWFMTLVALFTILAFQRLTLPAAPPPDADRPSAAVRYMRLLKARRFMGYQVSHALAFTGLIVFIMAAPYLLVTHLGHTTTAFIVMQATLILSFVIVANLAGKLTDHFGIDRVILAGAVFQMISGVAFLAVVVFRTDWLGPVSFTLTMLPMAIGLGFRGGPGFARAMAFCGKHTGSAGGLMMFTAMGMSAVGTQIVAPYLVDGAFALALTMVALCAISLVLLPIAMKPEPGDQQA
ncbi:MAG: MFS transporter [Alphaproteobacteria bacterium]|nr:MFS transporter [Alphaproteobacteria bacterium]